MELSAHLRDSAHQRNFRRNVIAGTFSVSFIRKIESCGTSLILGCVAAAAAAAS